MGEFCIAAVAILTREVRGVHLPKVQEMKDLIQTAWIASSYITVQLLANGKYLIVDGMHRLSAVLSLIMDKILPPNYEVPCVVYRGDTPEHLLLRFACTVNLGNQATAIMTFIDKMRCVACYMQAIVAAYVRDNSKIKPGEIFHWKDITAEHVKSSLQGPGGKEIQNFSLGVCQRTIGLIRALWVDCEEPPGTPLLYARCTAYNELLVMDQLGQNGYAAWFACFAHSWGLAKEKAITVLPGTRSDSGRKKKGKSNADWKNPRIVTMDSIYPKFFTSTPKEKPKWTSEVVALGQHVPYHFLMRMYIGFVARTGKAAVHDEGLWMLNTIKENPRLIVLWANLRQIAEPSSLHIMADSAAGFALMAQHMGKDRLTEEKACACTCHVEHHDLLDYYTNHKTPLHRRSDPNGHCDCHTKTFTKPIIVDESQNKVHAALSLGYAMLGSG